MAPLGLTIASAAMRDKDRIESRLSGIRRTCNAFLGCFWDWLSEASEEALCLLVFLPFRYALDGRIVRKQELMVKAKSKFGKNHVKVGVRGSCKLSHADLRRAQAFTYRRYDHPNQLTT